MTRPDTSPTHIRTPGGPAVEINPGDRVAFTIAREVIRTEEGVLGDTIVYVRDEAGREHEVPHRIQVMSRIEVWPAEPEPGIVAVGTGRGSDPTGKPDGSLLFERFLDQKRAGADSPYPVVTVEHPLADRVARAFSIYERVRAGDWGVIVNLFPEKVADPDVARAALRRLARDRGATGTTEPYNVNVIDLGEGYFTVTGPLAEIRSALDLYHRVQMGQWSEVMWACPPADHFDHDLVNDVRVRHQKDGAWPDHVRAYIGIAQATEAARVAYHVYKKLDDHPGEPSFSLLAGPVEVVVENRDTGETK